MIFFSPGAEAEGAGVVEALGLGRGGAVGATVMLGAGAEALGWAAVRSAVGGPEAGA